MSEGTNQRFVTDDRRASARMAHKPSVIYFAQRASDNLVKIGVSTDLDARIRRLRVEFKDDTIELLNSFDGGRYLEDQLHRLLAPYCAEGEWFKPSEMVLAAARGGVMSAGDPDPFKFAEATSRPTRKLSTSTGGRDALRLQILNCWKSGLSGRDTAALLQITVSKLTREVKVMAQLDYFNP